MPLTPSVRKISSTLHKNNQRYLGQKSEKRNWVSNSWLITIFAAFVIGGSVLAKTSDDDGKLPHVLDAFLATDSSSEQSLFCRGRCHLAKISHRITSFDIDNMGAKTLLEILQGFFGVIAQKDYFGMPQLGIYGIAWQSRIAIFIDGVRHNDPYTGTACLSLPSQIIDYVDVYYGPQGTWVGEGALVGVIAITTKQAPTMHHYSYLGSDLSSGAGMHMITRTERMRTGIHASYSSLHFVDHEHRHSSATHALFGDNTQVFGQRSFWASGFVDGKISQTAQAHIVANSTVTVEEYGPYANFPDLARSFASRKLAWLSEFHLLKKRAQRNALDVFFASGFFRGRDEQTTFNKLKNDSLIDKTDTLRLEIGTKFHFQPIHSHDLFFGIGGVIQGLMNGGRHIVVDDNMTSREHPFRFAQGAKIFGRPSALFMASSGHVYAFVQDDWRIKAPLLFSAGTRIILPIDSGDITATVLPTLGVVLIPTGKFRIKLGLHSGFRLPTVYEQSDRYYERGITDSSVKETMLDPENSHTVDASVSYGDSLGETLITTTLSLHVTWVTDAISTDFTKDSSNYNELHVAGIQSISEVAFLGGHSFTLGMSYSVAHRRVFDENGRDTCAAGPFGIFSDLPWCPKDKTLPSFSLRSTLSFDILSGGSLNFATTFMGISRLADFVTEPITVFEVAYLAKPIWRYFSPFITVKSMFGGKRRQTAARTGEQFERSMRPNIVAMTGFSITI